MKKNIFKLLILILIIFVGLAIAGRRVSAFGQCGEWQLDCMCCDCHSGNCGGCDIYGCPTCSDIRPEGAGECRGNDYRECFFGTQPGRCCNGTVGIGSGFRFYGSVYTTSQITGERIYLNGITIGFRNKMSSPESERDRRCLRTGFVGSVSNGSETRTIGHGGVYSFLHRSYQCQPTNQTIQIKVQTNPTPSPHVCSSGHWNTPHHLWQVHVSNGPHFVGNRDFEWVCDAHPPSVTSLNPLPDCSENGTIQVQATDSDGTVDSVELRMRVDATNYDYVFNLLTGSVTEPASTPFNLSSYSIPAAGANVTVSATFSNLADLGQGEEETIYYRARAIDNDGLPSDYFPAGSWRSFREEWFDPNPSISVEQNFDDPNGQINVTFSDNSSKPGNCKWGAYASRGENNDVIINDWPNITFFNPPSEGQLLPTLGSGVCNGSASFTPAPAGYYYFYLQGDGGLCGTDRLSPPGTIGVVDPDAWIMTGLGDVFVRDGFKNLADERLAMWRLNYFGQDPPIPVESDMSAYFSTNIISKVNSSYPWTRSNVTGSGKSFKGYHLDNYYDLNQDLVGIDEDGSSLYSYLVDLSEENNCGSNCVKIGSSYSNYILNHICDEGNRIVFVRNDLIFNGDFVPSESVSCVFIVKGNVSVSPYVEQINAFILVDGEFETNINTGYLSTLFIKGGLITSQIELNRYMNNSADDPAELIEYDPKYLDILRDLLGETYPYKIKEYSYSNPE